MRRIVKILLLILIFSSVIIIFFLSTNSFKNSNNINYQYGTEKDKNVQSSFSGRSFSENEKIILSEGIHIINNPIILDQNGITFLGKGKEKTFVYPKNSGQEIFNIAASDVHIEGMTINGKLKHGVGRSTFAVKVNETSSNIKIVNTRIINSGASGIIGTSTKEILIDGCDIINSGDDAIQLRGHQLTISNNRMFRFGVGPR